MPPHEVQVEGSMPLLSVGHRALAELSRGQAASFATRASPDWGGVSPYSVALDLVEKGLARALRGGRFEAIDYDAEKAATPDWIWLPNTIVTSASGETPPLCLLRQTQDPAALQLFEIYTIRTDWLRTVAFTGGG